MLVSEGSITFTVPPFPYRVCVASAVVGINGTANVNVVNSSFTPYSASSSLTWSELHNKDQAVYKVGDTAEYFWDSASVMYTGDFAAIRIVQNGFRHAFQVPSSTDFTTGDMLKLVPAGFPCTYDQQSKQDKYCGSHNVLMNGDLNPVIGLGHCATEGSVQDGVARIGTSQYNPFSESRTT
eukprot:PhM_4_TR16278/c0_g1_i1/m.90272